MCNHTHQTSDLSPDISMNNTRIGKSLLAVKKVNTQVDYHDLEPSTIIREESGSFLMFRLQYLVVFAAIMLADGLQGAFTKK